MISVAIQTPKWQFVAGLVLMAPETPGVYALWDQAEIIYLGATRSPRSTIRSRLTHHLVEKDRWRIWPTHFGWEISYQPAQRECELLAEFQALHKRLPRFNTPVAAARKRAL
jgi:excinuclease UvrABC nuclease subunit